MSRQQDAFHLAKQAAELDFDFALQGLMAGHQAAMERMRDALAQKDMAFLMALALTEKGARLDKDGIMAGKIAEALKAQKSLCKTESNFLARVESS